MKAIVFLLPVAVHFSQASLADEGSSSYDHITRAVEIELVNTERKTIILRKYTDSFSTQVYEPEYRLPLDIGREEASFGAPEETLATYMSASVFKNMKEDPAWKKEVLWLLRGKKIDLSDSEYIERAEDVLESAGVSKSYVPTITLTRRVIDTELGYAYLEGYVDGDRDDRRSWMFSKEEIGWVFQTNRRTDIPPVTEALLREGELYISKKQKDLEGEGPGSVATSTRVPDFALE